jgi:hypothetical protein
MMFNPYLKVSSRLRNANNYVSLKRDFEVVVVCRLGRVESWQTSSNVGGTTPSNAGLQNNPKQ